LTDKELLIQRSALELMTAYIGINEDFLLMQDK
jgi:hypothetical protein